MEEWMSWRTRLKLASNVDVVNCEERRRNLLRSGTRKFDASTVLVTEMLLWSWREFLTMTLKASRMTAVTMLAVVPTVDRTPSRAPKARVLTS